MNTDLVYPPGMGETITDPSKCNPVMREARVPGSFGWHRRSLECSRHGAIAGCEWDATGCFLDAGWPRRVYAAWQRHVAEHDNGPKELPVHLL